MTDASDSLDYESVDMYFQKGDEIIGLHATVFPTEMGSQQLEAWANLYNVSFKFLGSLYRIFGPIEDEAESLRQQSWVQVQRPKTKIN